MNVVQQWLMMHPTHQFQVVQYAVWSGGVQRMAAGICDGGGFWIQAETGESPGQYQWIHRYVYIGMNKPDLEPGDFGSLQEAIEDLEVQLARIMKEYPNA